MIIQKRKKAVLHLISSYEKAVAFPEVEYNEIAQDFDMEKEYYPEEIKHSHKITIPKTVIYDELLKELQEQMTAQTILEKWAPPPSFNPPAKRKLVH